LLTAVTVGVGLTVIVKLDVVPVQPLAVGVIVIVALMDDVVALVAVNDGMSPDPLAARPMAALLFVHVNVVPETGPTKVVTGTVAPLQKLWLLTAVTVGVGLIVTV
jgi:hypothetical protein